MTESKEISNTPQIPAKKEAFNAAQLLMSPDGMMALNNFAKMMAGSGPTIPDHLRGQEGDCMAVTIQAMQWGMLPHSVAQKTHLIHGTLGYEAQLVNAVVTSSTAIEESSFEYEYSEGWENLAGKVKMTGAKNNIPTKTWTDEDEKGLWVRVGATPRGKPAIVWGERLYLASVIIRNSTQWVTDPGQQISYLSVKKWVRKYTPAVLLGVYTVDELEAMPAPQPEKEIQGERVNDLRPASVTETELDDFDEAPQKDKPAFQNVDEILQKIAGAETPSKLEALKNIASNVEGQYLAAVMEAYSGRGKAIEILQEIAGVETLDELKALKNKAASVEAQYLSEVQIAYGARGNDIIQGYGPKVADQEEKAQNADGENNDA